MSKRHDIVGTLPRSPIYRASFYNQAMKPTTWILVGLLLVLAACTSTVQTPGATATTPTAAPTATPAPAATPEPVALTVWLPDWMLLDDPEAARLIQNTIQSFGVDNNIDIDIVIKLPTGPAGLLDSLSKTYPVAPAALPDLIALPLRDAASAAEQNLLQPLNGLLPDDLPGDLYPFANHFLASPESWYALPFAADFEHLAFQPSTLSDIPLNWDVILESKARYAFPAGGPEATLPDAVLIHYLSATTTNTLDRDEAALRKLLTFYEVGRDTGVINANLTQAASAADTWTSALQGDVDLAHTTASLWLRDRSQATILRFGPIPTADSSPRAIAHGWAFALVTADPTRQALAAQLITLLMEPDTLAAWTLTAHQLPSRRSALALWPSDDYTAFAGETLEKAILSTALTPDADFSRSVHRAVIDVLSGKADAETALQTAIATW